MLNQPHNNEPKKVIVTDINMSFMSMVIFMVKWSIAAIPAIIILAIIGTITTVFFGALLTTP